MKKAKKPDTLAVIDNYNFCDKHTHRQTDGHGNSMTDPAQRAESLQLSDARFKALTCLININLYLQNLLFW